MCFSCERPHRGVRLRRPRARDGLRNLSRRRGPACNDASSKQMAASRQLQALVRALLVSLCPAPLLVPTLSRPTPRIHTSSLGYDALHQELFDRGPTPGLLRPRPSSNRPHDEAPQNASASRRKERPGTTRERGFLKSLDCGRLLRPRSISSPPRQARRIGRDRATSLNTCRRNMQLTAALSHGVPLGRRRRFSSRRAPQNTQHESRSRSSLCRSNGFVLQLRRPD